MGIKHSWIAVQGLKPEQALEALGMEVKELIEPRYLPDGIGMAQLPNGWLLFVSDRKASALEGKLNGLAKFGPAVACDISETVMCSEAHGYEAGQEIWSVSYDCEKGRYALQTTGSPPPQLDEIHRTMRAKQEAEGGEEADVDYMFDVPTKLAQSICSYMMGETEGEDFRYAELGRIGGASPKGSGFFARLFGRG
jgi:hypothetical protein